MPLLVALVGLDRGGGPAAARGAGDRADRPDRATRAARPDRALGRGAAHGRAGRCPGTPTPRTARSSRSGRPTRRSLPRPGRPSSAQANAGALAVSLFAGEITLDSLDLRASVAAGSVSASGNVVASSLTGLTVLGQLITPVREPRRPARRLGHASRCSAPPWTRCRSRRGRRRRSSRRIRVKLIADHGGLAVGQRDRDRRRSRPLPPPRRPSPPPRRSRRGRRRLDADRAPGDSRRRPARAGQVDSRRAAGARPARARGHGPAHERRLRLPRLRPGVVRRHLRGSPRRREGRLASRRGHLRAARDAACSRSPTGRCSRSAGTTSAAGGSGSATAPGNEFYYAHLSAYSPLAVNGRQVKAGDVLGFMGKTGDAEFSPVHLHFEIHPVSLLAMGYDGAVAPYPFLNAWRRAQDVSFDAGRAYLPIDGPAPRGAASPHRQASCCSRPTTSRARAGSCPARSSRPSPAGLRRARPGGRTARPSS